jgi:hypothetical protein
MIMVRLRFPLSISSDIGLGDRIMKRLLFVFALIMGFGFTHQAIAQTPAPVTATCKDGTSFSGKTRSGACRGVNGNLNLTHLCAKPATWN